jgi:hypothetical protein
LSYSYLPWNEFTWPTARYSQGVKVASRELETLGDQSRPVAEQQRRKRTLIRGPKEFRDIRADLPKQKPDGPALGSTLSA